MVLFLTPLTPKALRVFFIKCSFGRIGSPSLFMPFGTRFFKGYPYFLVGFPSLFMPFGTSLTKLKKHLVVGFPSLFMPFGTTTKKTNKVKLGRLPFIIHAFRHSSAWKFRIRRCQHILDSKKLKGKPFLNQKKF